jgi:hypothetical protein
MDDYADIYFIDENRNAVTTHDHRTGGNGGSRPSSIRVQSAQPVRTTRRTRGSPADRSRSSCPARGM